MKIGTIAAHLLLFFAFPCMADSDIPAPIVNSAVVELPLDKLWAMWTTNKGLEAFVAIKADVEPKVRGKYRVLFFPDQPDPLDQGNDGTIIAMEPMKMLSVTWMTPIEKKQMRGNSTSLVLYFDQVDATHSRVRLVNSGYGLGPEWAEAYAYNVRGWDRVLSCLEYSVKTGPIDWNAAKAAMKAEGGFPWWREKRRAAAQSGAK